ncbi:MAG: hypothetical protein QOD99_2043 [Chthoniobacter sp.]|nr:hypothetical protein [Chthoniobacter sp.]
MGGGTLTLSGTLSPTSNNRGVNFSSVGNVFVTGPITGAQLAITQNGAGFTTLSGTNTHSLATTVNAGTLVIGNGITGSIGNSAVTVNAGTLSGNLTNGNNIGTTGTPLTILGNSTGSADATSPVALDRRIALAGLRLRALSRSIRMQTSCSI